MCAAGGAAYRPRHATHATIGAGAVSTPRIALVTGGASGIGVATAARLRAGGFGVAVVDLDPSGAKEAVGDFGLLVTADVADAPSVERAVSEVLDWHGRIDLLVNNAGITGSRAATILHTTPIEEFDRVIAVNVRGPFLITRAVLPTMIEQGGGHVIVVASTAALRAFPGRCAYTASKGAALQLAQSIAVDYAAHGIRANAICPGFTATPMTQWRLDVPELRAQVEARIPMGRVGEPGDVAEAIAALAADGLAFVTGTAFVVDGGMNAH